MSEGITSAEIWFAVILIIGIITSMAMAYKEGYSHGKDIGVYSGKESVRREMRSPIRDIDRLGQIERSAFYSSEETVEIDREQYEWLVNQSKDK